MRGLIFSAAILLTSFAYAGNPPGHWSFPGDIRSHLQQGHGIPTAGMSYEQMLNMHDHLHETGQPVRVQKRTIQQPAQHSIKRYQPTRRPVFFLFRR